VIAPIAIVLGRIGCVWHGCCPGRVCEPSWFTVNGRWPAAIVELLFNALILGVVLVLRRKKILSGRHFHLYLLAYGSFRFVHEFLRDTPAILGPFSGYQIVALAVAALGWRGLVLRKNSPEM